MTWKTVTTATLSCKHTTYYRNASAPTAGDTIQCPYCEVQAVVKGITVTQRRYDKPGGKEHIEVRGQS